MPLGKRTDCGDAKYSGMEVSFACDVVEALEVLTTHSRAHEATAVGASARINVACLCIVNA